VALSETTDSSLDFEAADLARTAGSMGYQQMGYNMKPESVGIDPKT
jgi:hypothetical protein